MYNKFHAYLCDLESGFSKLSQLLHQKLAALERLDVNRLDEIIKEEQVFVLISKGFDSNVLGYKEALSLKGEKLSDIIEELPGEQRQRFREIFTKLKAALNESSALNQKCQDLIAERLHILDKEIKGLDRSATPSYGRGPAADTNRLPDMPQLFATSI